jgi:ankyrin repeat protein
MKAILRGRGASTGTLEKLPWSVQVEIANRYKRLTGAEDSSVEGFAHLNLAICHYLGFGVERDTEKVGEHIHASALRGTPEARLVINPLSQLLGFEGLDAVGDPRFDSIKYPEFDSELRIMLTARTRYPYRPPFRELLAHWFEKIASMGVKGWDLHSAAASNDFEATSRFIRDGSADYQNKKGQTALLLACQNGSFRIAKLLLENGSDPSLPDDNGYTPLHMLSMFADDDIEPLCKLVQSTNPLVNLEAFSATPCPLPDFWDVLIGTPLQWAVSAGNLVAVKALVDIGADPINAPGWFSPIQLASSLLLPNILQILLEKATPSDIERHGLFFLNGSHPFRQIMIHGKELPRTVQRTIQLLSSHGGVDITTSWGTTPLMNVALSNFSSTDVLIARELLKTCDTTIDSSRFSTIQAGIIGCNGTPSKSLSEITLMLIHAGFSTRAVSSASVSWPGWNAMHWAVAGRSFDVVKQLHRRDPELLEIQTSSENREFPLHIAASAYYGLEMVKLLLELGADPCAESGYGLTPLMHCIGESRLQLNMEKFEVLLKANSKNGYVVQRNGNTILHQIALRAAMLDIEGLPGYELLGYVLSRPEIKALINKKNNNGLTPLHLVCVKPDYTSIRMLVEAGADVHSMTPEPNMMSPLGLVLEYSREPSKGFAGNDLGSVWHKFSYQAACYLSDYMKGMPQDKQLSRLHIAAYCGFIEEVERLVEQEGVDISAINAKGITPLQMVAGLHLLYNQKQLPMDIGYLQRSKHILTYLSTQYESKGETC